MAPGAANTVGGGNVAVYTFGSTANALPARAISGGLTGLATPVSLVLDSSGNLYVLDNGVWTSTVPHPQILVFGPGANGNVAPIRTISAVGTITSNLACETLVLDPTGNFLDVMCDDNGSGTIHILTASANGTASAAQQASMIDDSAWHMVSMAYDTSGNMWVTDTGSGGPNTATLGFVPGPIPTSGSLFQLFAPSQIMLAGSASFGSTISPIGVALDSAGTLYSTVAYSNSVAGAPDASNEIGVWNAASIPCMNCAPSRTLTGAPFTTHAPAGVALDAAGNVYMSNPFSNSVYVFAKSVVAGSATNPTVLHLINTSANSNPTDPVGIVVGP